MVRGGGAGGGGGMEEEEGSCGDMGGQGEG